MFGKYFMNSKSDLYSAVIAVLYVIPWYIRPRYNETRLTVVILRCQNNHWKHGVVMSTLSSSVAPKVFVMTTPVNGSGDKVGVQTSRKTKADLKIYFSSEIPLVSSCAWSVFFSWWRHQMETYSALQTLFVRGIHWWSLNSPHKGRLRGALMFSLMYACINGWINNGEAGDLRRHYADYDVTVMLLQSFLY